MGLTIHGVAALLASAPHLAGCSSRKTTLSAPKPGQRAGTADSSLGWLPFVEALSTMARAQFDPEWNQEEYVKEVIALMRRLDLEDVAFDSFYDDYVSAKGLFPEISSVHEGGHFAVATLEFDAGDRIRLHNHPDMTGVIFCL